MSKNPVTNETNRVLVKLRPSTSLRAAESRANLRPLFDTGQSASTNLGLDGDAQWFLADLPDGAASPWDLAHARLADQLGVDESDVVFAEPDIVNTIYQDPNASQSKNGLLAVGDQCTVAEQENTNGEAIGPTKGWHLTDDFSQLEKARAAVTFTEPRTRIAHIDTGYYASHISLPRRLNKDLQRNFVGKDGNPTSAQDPDDKAFLIDNSGHGTGTLSILAGNLITDLGNIDMGGAPDADVVPLRIADSVVLLHTSNFARALGYAVDIGCDVLSMSMGGLPSNAWREVVDRAYMAGLCMVTAAGNNFAGLPTRNIVYPARYGRVICACGAMANGNPYAFLQNRAMEGNFGPPKCMDHAISGYSPNIPWAVYGCPTIVRRNGGGTSSATPQVAAAAALWYEKYKNELPRDWRRVEAVRKALFTTAAKGNHDQVGNGVVRAFDALAVRPDLTLSQTKSDNDSFSFLRIITGLGIAEPAPREQMFNVEIAQRWMLNPELQKIVPDPDGPVDLSAADLQRFMEAVIEDKDASIALRKQVASRYSVVTGKPPQSTPATSDVVPQDEPVAFAQPAVRAPAYRRVRIYAVDPSLSTRLDTADINEATLKVRWEPLEPGPEGEYLKVTDTPIADQPNAVNLDDARLLAQDGWAPSEGNPQFHQQMVYGVVMTTIENFERAMGRPLLWRSRTNRDDEFDDGTFVQKLEARPHAFRQANAFYSPDEIALQFGYFDADASDPNDLVPGSRVYTCLSHDIVAHETTHAILDGMHRRFNEPTNPDVLAFHEAFADIVALLQHFTMRDFLEMEIARTRGDIEAESMLGSLAVQFGRATGGRGALREAIGSMENGVWKRGAPDPTELERRLTPHSRGAILVAAVFDAFIAIYKTRTQDLIRIYTGGTGVLPTGAIHPDLVKRLADEAAKSADHVLGMCIRALDYVPPVDVTFFEYLRGLITADFDLVTDDQHNYRVAFVEAFRRRGIYPVNIDSPTPDTLRTLSVDTVRWQGLDSSLLASVHNAGIRKQYRAMVERLRRYANSCLYLKDRETLFNASRRERTELHAKLEEAFASVPEFATELGLDPKLSFEVHELRPAMRVSPDGRYVPQVIVAITQSMQVPADKDAGVPAHTFRGGSTLLVDLSVPEVKYRIVKRITSESRRERTAAFVADAAKDPLRALFFGPDRKEPFAALHSLAEDVR